MLTRAEKLRSITEWSEQCDDVRVMLLTSSLVNPLAPVDHYSDLDIELVFADNSGYVSDKEWVRLFGEPLAVYEEGEAGFVNRHAMKMVLYEDHVKVDFKLYSLPAFAKEVSQPELSADWDMGYRVLVDKDGLTQNLAIPTHRASIISKPSQQVFEKLLFDFWWDTTYVAKSLARGDLFYAKYMSETIIRTQYLVPLIEWYIAGRNNWSVTTNKHGRLFRKYLPESIWQCIERTFSGLQVDENWDALFAMGNLVHELGNTLSAQLCYAYPNELEARIRAYLLAVRTDALE